MDSLAKKYNNKNKKQGFTLAEVLITLVIIGIVAALVMPMVVERVKQYEYKTSAKKAFSDLNSAIQTVALQKEITPGDEEAQDSNERYMHFIKSNLNIIKESTDVQGNEVFYTADGFRYHVINSYTYYVDVNGEKAPNKIDTPKSSWKAAQCENEQALFALNWDGVIFSDMFYIYFNPNNGRSIIFPYINNVEDLITNNSN